MHKVDFAIPGSFSIGCNYWASHAGTNMWTDWRPEIIENDFKILSEGGIEVLRVFPIWPVFQPITATRTYCGRVREIRFGEELLPDDEAGRAGISIDAMQRFNKLAEIAEKYHIKLIVGLINGWMSGRFYAPPAIEHLNAICDPESVKWQLRFIKYFINYFKDFNSIIAWDLGNECNCMAEAPDRNAAWVWSSTITNAIRAADSTRPVVSGMHSLTPQGIWAIEDQGEITDLLTTHPYPLFTHNCGNDPVNTIRSILHAAAESRYYGDIGGKPCFIEEMGTLNNMIASEEVTAMYVRASLFTQWAHDCRAFLWWCGFDQYFLTHAPYDWGSTEGELGLIRADGSKKPVFNEVSRFAGFLKKLPFDKLPERIKNAVCILSDEQDHWSIAYNSFILAKQSGIDIEFQYETQPIKDAALYLVPSISGLRVINKHRWQELLAKVNDGAILYISHESGLLDRFEELTGVRVETRERRNSSTTVNIGKIDGNPVLHINGLYRLKLNPVRTEILGTEEDGNPAFTCASYGKGWVYFLSFPVELELANRPGSYEPDSEPYYLIYKHIAAKLKKGKVISRESPFVGVTEHPADSNARIVVAVNYRPEPIEFAFNIDSDWKPSDVFYGGNIEVKGDGFNVDIPANDACVFKIEKEIIHASIMSIDK